MKNKKITYRKSAWIYIKNFRILAVRTKGYSAFFLPGGGIEKKETFKEALIREIKEELNVDIIPKTIKYIRAFKSPTYEDPKNSDVIMRCFSARFNGSLKASSEIEEFNWFSHKDKNKVSQADQYAFDYLKLNKMIG